ncbi:hypothetical protein [Sulfurimonas sp.]|jgi:hypothetical protein|uniref:hypothetical protein n=1 Tax=Sulfurimonas sp. TaxID=2022749 RepID=UPI0025FA37A0|nr:hypothetical protein [Sulfurimonas sp.]MCK9472171.1 hypothetical protein [Sulfurimonas sp.]
MIAVLKRYALALLFLLLISILMLLGTIGVKSFGKNMIKDTGIEMKPRGEQLIK